jgi:formyltetrahydrofolate-dependent phosphoribosylglycinamide formyltransferase
MKRLAVMVSGNGSNLQALIDHTQSGDLDAEIGVVISNNPNAYGLQRAARAAIPTEVLTLEEVAADGGDRTAYNVELAGLVSRYEPDLVVLAGWMLILNQGFLDHFGNNIINLHPALPGAFPGTDAIARAHAAFHRGKIKHTGVMVHRVTAEVDAGQVIVSEPVPIFRDESVADLEERVHMVEHNLIVAAVDMVLRAMP